MGNVVHYNFIVPVIEKMTAVLNRYPEKKLIWFGNSHYVSIMNTVLLKTGKYISAVLDNDEKKWGSEVENFYQTDLAEKKKLAENVPKIFIQSPEWIKSREEAVVVFLASRFEAEMVRQLKDYGVQEEFIYTFPTSEEECVLRNQEVQSKLLGWRPLTLREQQLRELEILKYFRNFCEEHQLRYFLGGGTLLGAVRHKGFIPWDDDVDVYMPFDDYEKFLETYQKTEKYALCDWTNEEQYTLQFAKLLDRETLLLEGGFPIQIQLGVYIDIFPLAGFPEDLQKREKKQKENIKLNKVWQQYYIARDILGKVEDPREQIFEKKSKEYPFEKSKFIGAFHIRKYQYLWAVEAECFSKSVPVLFEGEYFSAPIKYKEYLTCRYGDYMEIPEEKDRIAHLFPAYIQKEGIGE